MAMSGSQHDGHSFLHHAYQSGVRHFIVEQPAALQDANVLLVDSSQRALQQIATHHRLQFHYPVVGITGSNGKTIVKEWLAQLIGQEKKVVKSPKSFNSQIGVPLSVLEMGAHEVGVFEAGISKKGEMEALQSVIRPTHGLFTNIGEAHSEGFASLLEKMEEKARLFRDCEVVICHDEHAPIVEVLRAKFGERLKTWSSENPDADFFFDVKGSTYHLAQSSLVLDLPFTNPHQVENALHAVVMAHVLGISDESIQSAIQHFRSVPMRLELKRALNGCSLIDDSYNNDLIGLEVALDFTNQQNPHQPKTVILSDILQSSLPDGPLYERVKKLLEAKGVQRVFVVGDRISAHFPHNDFPNTETFLGNLPHFENETILVKGARPFAFERIVDRLQDQSHQTVLEINFEAVRKNLLTYRKLLQPNTKLMVMVKAFAYGAGLSEIAGVLQHERVDYLGVAYADEAVQLRKKGITVPIMIMNPEEVDFDLFERYDLEAEIYSVDVLQRLIQSGAHVRVHIKLETGMNRLGFSSRELPALLDALKEKAISVAGLFTHFSSSDDPDEDDYTHAQAAKFQQMAQSVIEVLGYRPLVHAVNSPGMVRFPEYQFDMARLGIGLYGFDPTGQLKLQTVGTLKTHISQVKSLQPGESIGYGRSGKVTRASEIAIVPIGYADGYGRVFGNGTGKVNIHGHWAPTIGNICMDMMMVDVTGLGAQAGDEVIIFGESPTIVDLADWAGTIPYEILTGISQRVKRVYVSE